jgi:transposase
MEPWSASSVPRFARLSGVWELTCAARSVVIHSPSMAPPLPNTTRELIIFWHHALDYKPSQIAALARCDVSTVHKILARFREHGNPHALPRGQASRSLNDDDIRHILSILSAKPTLFLDEIQERLWTERDVWVSISTISRVLDRVGWSKKRLSREAAERNHLLRCAWKAKYGSIPMRCFLWIDESGIEDRDHLRRDGWSPLGLAPVCSERFGGDPRVTMLPALSCEGIVAMEIMDGGVTTDRFVRFLAQQVVS